VYVDGQHDGAVIGTTCHLTRFVLGMWRMPLVGHALTPRLSGLFGASRRPAPAWLQRHLGPSQSPGTPGGTGAVGAGISPGGRAMSRSLYRAPPRFRRGRGGRPMGVLLYAGLLGKAVVVNV